MSVNDPIADFLTRIRNAKGARLRFVDMDWNKMRESLAAILKEEGFISDVLIKKENDSRGKIRLFLKYGGDRVSVIDTIKRCSRPGRRLYLAADEIFPVRGGLGIAILSTSQGVMTDRKAKEKRIGGELLCQVW